MSNCINLYLTPELQDVLESKAAELDIDLSKYIKDYLTHIFKDELNWHSQKSYIDIYLELKYSFLKYKNTLKPKDQFTLKDVPFYKNLYYTNDPSAHPIPSGVRSRLRKDLYDEINTSLSNDFLDVARAYDDKGKPLFRKCGNTSMPVYIKI